MKKQIREHYYEWDKLFLKCSICENFKDSEEFSKDKTKGFWFNWRCKECDKKHSRNYRLDNFEKVAKQKKKYNEAHREQRRQTKKKFYAKRRAEWINIRGIHKKTEKYIKKNKIRVNICSVCGKECNTAFHHIDYNKWNCWVFVCVLCHNNIHAWHIDCPEPVDLIQLNAHMPIILTDKDLEYTDAETWLY